MKFCKSIVLTILAAAIPVTALAKTSNPPKSAKIVGGAIAEPKEWKSFVLIGRKDAQGAYVPMCGATMIDAYNAITAAHCMEEFSRDLSHKCGEKYIDPSALAIFPGAYDMSLLGRNNAYSIKKVTTHNNAGCTKSFGGIGEKYDNDIAIIRLDRKWDGEIARLSLNAKDDPDDGFVTVAGFGRTGIDTREKVIARDGVEFSTPSKTLLKVTVPLVATSDCAEGHIESNGVVGEKQICAGWMVRPQTGFVGDSCNGDSGGPLVSYDRENRPFLIGVVSWGPNECGKVGAPGIYTRLSAHAKWIKSIVPNVKSAKPIYDGDIPSNDLIGFTALDELLSAAKGRVKIDLCIYRENDDCGVITPKINEKGFVKISSENDGQLIFIDQNAQNTLTQIYPANGVKENIGGENKDTKEIGPYVVTPPKGKSKLLVIVAPKDADLSGFLNSQNRLSKGVSVTYHTGYGENGADFYAASLANEIAAILNKSATTTDLPGWGYGVLEYDVTE